MKATVTHVGHDSKHNIVFIEDLSNRTSSISITNDAENVVDWFRLIYGTCVRIVYKDTNMEWWEIDWVSVPFDGIEVTFKPWNGLEWDILSRKEQYETSGL